MPQAIKHRRFLYKLTSIETIRVGIVIQSELHIQLSNAIGFDWPAYFDNEISAFESTFNYGSKFVRWIDNEWITTDIED
ncbi:MAG: hypothetical protein WC810_28200 [Janthinobacterium sp.]|jgi:hypothetical protein